MDGKMFKEAWNENNLIHYNQEVLSRYNVPENICGNLVRYGLPDSAAPYLNFECAPQMEGLENDYFYLGYTGNGDLICLNRSTENIVILEHEIYNIDEDEDEDYEYDEEDEGYDEDEGEDYEYEGCILLNSSIDKLYDFLVIYKIFMEETDKNGKLLNEEIENLKKKFEETDEKAMRVKDSFWNQEIQTLERSLMY